MIAPHWASLMAEVPLSVRRSMNTFSEGKLNGLKPARRRTASRSAGVVRRIRSTTLIR